MRRSRRSASSPRRKSSSFDPWTVILHLLIAVIFVSAAVSIFRISQIYVDRRLAFPTHPPKAVLTNRPAWMSDFLAEQIVKSAQPIGLHSAFDRQLLLDTANALKSNPWIRRINQIRRVYGEGPGDTIEIDCQYRAPVALVQWGDYYWLVDGQGVKLPEQYAAEQLPKIMFGSDGRMNVRIIEGVAHAPPESGNRWSGDDLSGGLELARLLCGQDYAEQIRIIDVSNFGGRRDDREAQIVLVTQFNTQIRWGRPPSAKDGFVEVAASAKLAALQNIFRQDKRIDAHQPWIDLRFDRVTCPE
ncbi:MAG: hypothetical protein ABR964_05380 [Tepidisphaeraceae bacterium]